MSDHPTAPSDAEIEILQVLWDCEPASVRTVHERLSADKDVGYTTTLKQMQRMLEKGLLLRTEDGKTHLYTAVIKAPEMRQSLFSRLLNGVFNGSAYELMMHAIGQSKPRPEEIAALEKLIKEKKNQLKDE